MFFFFFHMTSNLNSPIKRIKLDKVLVDLWTVGSAAVPSWKWLH